MDGIYDLVKRKVPPQARFYTQTMFGDRSKPLTEKDLSEEDLRNLHEAVANSRIRLKQKIESDDSEAGKKHKKQFDQGYGNVQYADYTQIPHGNGAIQYREDNPMHDTLGRFGYQILPDGTIHVNDKYDFSNENRIKNVERFEKEGPIMKAIDSSTKAIGQAVVGDIRPALATMGEAYIGRNGRPVDITYHPNEIYPEDSVYNPKQTLQQSLQQLQNQETAPDVQTAPPAKPLLTYKKGGMIDKPLQGNRRTI
jgi:hypothetical protein